MRIIAAVRLSRVTDETTSPERQAENLRDYAKRNGHTIVHEVADLDVSGGKAIRKRPGVGAWLTPEHLGDWDAIAGYSIDRMFRDLYDFVTFYHDFLKPNGKSIIITSEQIDMSTSDGVMMAQWRVMMAENELNKISKRNKDAAEWTRQAGLWKGGQIPWGYMPVRADYNGRPHWVLKPNPQLKELINHIAGEIIAGKSVAEVARILTRMELPTGRKLPSGEPRTNWRPGPLIRLLRMETLKGYVPYNHRLIERDGKKRTVYEFVRNPDGSLMRRDPILADDKWAELQEALKRPVQAARGKRRDASPLLHIIKCATCKAPLHHNAFTSRGTRYRYYTCNHQGTVNCAERSIPADAVERWLEEWIAKGDWAYRKMIEHRIKPGIDHKEEIEKIQLQIATLDQLAADYDAQHAKWRAELKRVLELPVKPPEARDIELDLLLKDYWPTLTPEQKRAHLLRAGVTIYARRNPDAGSPLDIWPEGDPTRVVGALTRKAA